MSFNRLIPVLTHIDMSQYPTQEKTTTTTTTTPPRETWASLLKQRFCPTWNTTMRMRASVSRTRSHSSVRSMGLVPPPQGEGQVWNGPENPILRKQACRTGVEFLKGEITLWRVTYRRTWLGSQQVQDVRRTPGAIRVFHSVNRTMPLFIFLYRRLVLGLCWPHPLRQVPLLPQPPSQGLWALWWISPHHPLVTMHPTSRMWLR